jgi:hypothetical protein
MTETILITRQRVNDEDLRWQKIDQGRDEDGIKHIDLQIIDAAGNVYHGIIQDNGSVEGDGGIITYDSVKTYEGYKGAEPSGMFKRYGIYNKTQHHLYHHPETRDMFVRVVHPSVGEERVYSIDAAEIALWMLEIDTRAEPIIYKTEDALDSTAVSLPLELAYAIGWLPGNAIDWIRCILAEAVGDIALAGPPVETPKEGPPAYTAEQVREALAALRAGEKVPTYRESEFEKEVKDPESEFEKEVKETLRRLSEKETAQ